MPSPSRRNLGNFASKELMYDDVYDSDGNLALLWTNINLKQRRTILTQFDIVLPSNIPIESKNVDHGSYNQHDIPDGIPIPIEHNVLKKIGSC